jgi:predicted TIM-barrel fold metal-dependent hydrolase
MNALVYRTAMRRGCGCCPGSDLPATGRAAFPAGVGPAFAAAAGAGANPVSTHLPPRRVNVHSHFMPPTLKDPMKEASRGSPMQLSWTIRKSLDDMEAAGIAVSVLSLSTPGVSFLPREAARRAAREANEYAMKLIADHPGRFGSFVTLPMPCVEDSLKELEYGLDLLKMDGVCLMTSYRDRWLGDPSFAPLMEELDRRGAVVFVHPNLPDCCRTTLPGMPPSVIEYGFDTARAITNLIFTGSSMRCPNVKFIFTHGGGAMPMFLDRYESAGISKRELGAFTFDRVLAELGRFHYDTALAANAAAMAAIGKIAPVSQILLGTDYPLRASGPQIASLQKLFSAGKMQAIERGNALSLLPRLRAVMA